MGGQGSGRLPSIETIVKRSQPEQTPIGDSLFLPNYSGVQKAALKTETPLGTEGSGDPSVWQSGSGVIYYNDGNVGIGTSTPSTALEIIGAISGSSTLTISGSAFAVNSNGKVALGSNDFTQGVLFINASLGETLADVPLTFVRNTSNTSSTASAFRCIAKSSGNMSDGFGVRYRLEIEDGGSGPNVIGLIEGVRDGSDVAGGITFKTGAGTTTALKLRASGNVEILDNRSLIFGTGLDSSIKYDSENLVISPKLVGSGIVNVLGNISGSALIGNNLKIYQGVRWIKPYHYAIGATSQTFTAGRVLLTEFEVLNDCTADAISYTSVGTLSGSVIVGIYGPIGTEETCSGSSLIVQQSHTPTTTNSAQLISISGTSLVKGRYYLALEGEDALNTYTRESNVEKVEGWGQFYTRAGGYGELTNPCPAVTNTSSAIPGMLVRCSS